MIDLAKIEHVETFRKGDVVPDWLFAFTPGAKSESRASMTFKCDAAVIIAWGEYWVIASETDTEPFFIDGGGSTFNLAAASVPVVMPIMFHIMGREDARSRDIHYKNGGWKR